MVDRIRGGQIVKRDWTKKQAGPKNYSRLVVPPPQKSDLPDQVDRFSVSRMQSLVKCPFFFKLQYVDKFAILDESEYLQKGKELHEMFYYAAASGMPEVIRAFDGYNKYPEDCENFIRICKSIQIRTGRSAPLCAEKELYDVDDKVLMYIDRIDICGKDPQVVEILDYKTGTSGRVRDYVFQLAFYAFYVEKLLGLNVKRWGIMFTATGDIKYEDADRSKIAMIPEMVRMTREYLKECEKDGFGKRKNKHCYNCKFRNWKLCEGFDGSHPNNKNTYGLLDVYKYEWGTNGNNGGE